MGLFVDGFLRDIAVIGALGIDELRWRNPVHPGDEIAIDVSMSEKEQWSDQAGRVDFSVVGRNQEGKEVLSRTDLVLIERDQGV
jgi:acyl dehydratase